MLGHENSLAKSSTSPCFRGDPAAAGAQELTAATTTGSLGRRVLSPNFCADRLGTTLALFAQNLLNVS